MPTNGPLTNQPTNPAAIVIRAPATMPAAPQLFEPAGLCPDQPRGDMNTQSMINPLASSDVGGTAGHDAAACVSARGKCDGERVCYARDANCVLSPTTQSLPARQVVAPHGAPRGVVPPWGPPALRCCAPLWWALAAAPPVVGSGVVPPCGGRLLPPPAVGSGPVCRCPPTVLWLRRLLMMMTAGGSAPFHHH